MGKVIHRVNAPLVAGVVVRHAGDAVNDRVTHVDIRGGHVNLRPQHLLAVLVLAVPHGLEQFQIFLHRPVAVRAFLSRLGKRPPVLADLLGGQVAHVGLALADQFQRALVHRVKIIRREIQMLLPVRAQPQDVLLDGVDELHLLLGRVGIVEPHVERPVVFLGQSII